MKKRNILSLSLLAVYCVPWAFLAMYGDKELGTMLPFVLLFCVAAVLGWFSRRIRLIQIAAAGNLLSCLTSCLFAGHLWAGDSHYFKPFHAIGFVLVLSALGLMVQFLIWNVKKDRSPAMSLLVGVVAVFLLLLVCMTGMLYFSMHSLA